MMMLSVCNTCRAVKQGDAQDDQGMVAAAAAKLFVGGYTGRTRLLTAMLYPDPHACAVGT